LCDRLSEFAGLIVQHLLSLFPSYAEELPPQGLELREGEPIKPLTCYLGRLAEAVYDLPVGSVNAINAADIFTVPHVDGALVGGASLTYEAFSDIIRAAEQA